MRAGKLIKQSMIIALAITLLSGLLCDSAEARKRKSSGKSVGARTSHKVSSRNRHRGRHHAIKKSKKVKAQAKPRYAYPLELFMMEVPNQDLALLPADEALRVRYAFQNGTAGNFPPNFLVKSGAVNYHALRGGIFKRREPVKYIIIHSTETGVPQDSRGVINSWSSGGRRHPGAQYVVDRDGTIWMAVDPEYATVHVNIFKTLPGINNDNSIGIEMCHAGNQDYPPALVASVIRLTSYLQNRYKVLHENVITHKYAQQGDHTDPVAFDWEGFLSRKNVFHNRALAMKPEPGPLEAASVGDSDGPTAAVYLEVHQGMAPTQVKSQVPPKAPDVQRQVETTLAPKPATIFNTASDEPSAAPSFLPLLPGVPKIKQGAPTPGLRGAIEIAPSAIQNLGPNK